MARPLRRPSQCRSRRAQAGRSQRRAGRRLLQRSLDASDVEGERAGPVSAEIFLSLAASTDAATLEDVTGLCDVATNHAPGAASSRGVHTRRGGRATRAAYVRPRARADENTRLKIPGGQIHQLGQFEGRAVFGSLVSRVGIVSSTEGTLIVRAPLKSAIEVLGKFL